jgi:hypothetical protein
MNALASHCHKSQFMHSQHCLTGTSATRLMPRYHYCNCCNAYTAISSMRTTQADPAASYMLSAG